MKLPAQSLLYYVGSAARMFVSVAHDSCQSALCQYDVDGPCDYGGDLDETEENKDKDNADDSPIPESSSSAMTCGPSATKGADQKQCQNKLTTV